MRVIRPPYGHKRYKKKPNKWPYLLIALLFTGTTVAYTFFAATKPINAIQVGGVNLPEYVPVDPSIAWPSTGQAAIGDLKEGLLAQSATDQQQKPIASMTKVITVLSVLDKNPLAPGEQGEVYTVSATDAQLYSSYLAKNGSVLPVTVGQTLTQYQAIQAILLPSANNIADSLAVWTFGSMENYLQYANNLVKKYGLDNTTVSDASGFSPLTSSTPSNMIVIGQKALENSVVKEVVATKSATIPGSGEIRNSNLMLADPNVIGIKTGNTDEAGHCLLFAVAHGPANSHTLIGVVMGQSSWSSAYSNARKLRDSSLDEFANIDLLSESTTVANYQTEWGESTDIVNTTKLSIYGWKARAYKLKSEINDLHAPLSANQVVGKVNIEQYPETTSNLVTTSAINKPSISWRLTNFF